MNDKELSALTRYAASDYITRIGEMVESDDGEYVKLSDVQAILAAPARDVGGLTGDKVAQLWSESKGDSLREITRNFAAAIEREVLATKEAEPDAVSMLSGALNHARDALRYYAEQDHFVRYQPDEWDTVSGEPQNLYEDSAHTATVEDGSVAKLALEDIAHVERYAALATSPAPSVKQEADEHHIVSVLSKLVERVRYSDDCGPAGEGWQSDELERAIADADAIIATLGSKSIAAPSASQGEVKGWISVEDRLPEDKASVAFVIDSEDWPLFKYLHGRVLGGQYTESDGCFSVPGIGLHASHWMPLPAAPAPSVMDGEKK